MVTFGEMMNYNNYEERIQNLIKQAEEMKRFHQRGRKSACKELLSEAKALGDDNLLAFAHYQMGDCLYATPKQQSKGMQHIQKALVYSQRVGNDELLAKGYNLLGIDSANRGHIELSLEYQMMAKVYAYRTESNELQAMINFNIGYSFMDMKNEKQALKYYKESYRLSKKCKKDDYTALYCQYIICCVVGIIYVVQNKQHHASKMLEELEKLSKVDNPGIEEAKMEPLSFIFRMGIYLRHGKMELLRETDDALLEVLGSRKLTVDGVPDVIDFCYLLLKDHRYDRVEKYVENLFRIMQDVSIPHIQMSFYRLLIDYYGAIGHQKNKAWATEEYFKASELQEEESQLAFTFYAEMMESIEEIRLENIRLAKEARTDGLTKLPNRLDLNEVTEAWFDRAKEENLSLGVEIFDVDKFKNYNDTYGHQVGDICLVEIGRVLQSVAGENIYVARYGGDEFLLCYMGMTDDEILSVAKEIRSKLKEIRITFGEQEIVGISISQGIRNSVPTPNNKMWDYLYAADTALYELKTKKRGDILLLHKTILSHKALRDAVVGE